MPVSVFMGQPAEYVGREPAFLMLRIFGDGIPSSPVWGGPCVGIRLTNQTQHHLVTSVERWIGDHALSLGLDHVRAYGFRVELGGLSYEGAPGDASRVAAELEKTYAFRDNEAFNVVVRSDSSFSWRVCVGDRQIFSGPDLSMAIRMGHMAVQIERREDEAREHSKTRYDRDLGV